MTTGYYVIRKKNWLGGAKYLRVRGSHVTWVSEAPLASHFPRLKAKLVKQWAEGKLSIDKVDIIPC